MTLRDESDSPLSGQLDSRNLLSDLPSLGRMSKRDQRRLDMRLRSLAMKAKEAGAITLAANLLRASYELDVLP